MVVHRHTESEISQMSTDCFERKFAFFAFKAFKIVVSLPISHVSINTLGVKLFLSRKHLTNSSSQPQITRTEICECLNLIISLNLVDICFNF